jgi:aspartyl-tRNA(Asn)/glutamyl-tRNA(Gln) amidotransferase subunit B
MKFETIIGLEVHVHLATESKAFCGCSTEFGKEPNSNTCPVCLGFPGSLPVLNQKALDYAFKVALALNCQIQNFIKFDRKNYFYPDLPKNYQISQYDLPLSRNGYLDIDLKANKKRIHIRRVHLEEDAGKLIHREDYSLVDYNRAGIALLEIVSEPQINSAEEAYLYLINLKSLLEYLEVSDCDMEKGSLRCDANISLRRVGEKDLGTKTELKNMNSFKAVKAALQFEIERQTDLLNKGESITQDTRLWDKEEEKTHSMRSKEEAHDYRYFPEPDLVPFIVSEDQINKIKISLPEFPKQRKARFIRDYSLSDYDAEILTSEKKLADYFEECLKLYPNSKNLSNWIIGPLAAGMSATNLAINQIPFSKENFTDLIKFVDEGKLSNLAAKEVLAQMFTNKKSPQEIIEEKNLSQVSDKEELALFISEVLKENPKSVQDFKAGKENALMFLVGQVMKKTKGKANPKIVQELLKKTLEVKDA